MNESVRCPNPKCNARIGEAVNVNGLIMLRVGVLLIRDTQALCMQCGRVFYWSVSNKVITQIIKDAMLSK
jgi:hypothetical protein